MNRTFTERIIELSTIESDALLAMLCSWSEQPQFQCRYRWSEGCVGIWDNRCTQHYAVNDFTETRVIHRVTILGDTPAGDEPRWRPFENTTHSLFEALRDRGREHSDTDERTNSLSSLTAAAGRGN